MLLVPVALIVTACGGGDGAAPTTPFVPKKITIGYGPGPENKLITEIYAKALEQSNVRIARKQTTLDRDAALAALQSGEIQLYIDYSSGLLLQLDPDADVSPTTTSSTTSTTIDPATATVPPTTAFDPASTTIATTTTLSPLQAVLPSGLTTGAVSRADMADVVACKLPEGSTVTTLSGLTELDQDLRLAAPEGFADATPLGAGVLAESFGVTFKEIVTTAEDQIATTITGGGAECGVLSGIDPQITDAQLTVLTDDLAVLPQELAVPVLSSSIVTDVGFTVDAVSNLIDTATVRSLMALINQGLDPSLVAGQFLSSGQG
jgi:osmoprotectant transport system substrate-binding protein